MCGTGWCRLELIRLEQGKSIRFAGGRVLLDLFVILHRCCRNGATTQALPVERKLAVYVLG